MTGCGKTTPAEILVKKGHIAHDFSHKLAHERHHISNHEDSKDQLPLMMTP